MKRTKTYVDDNGKMHKRKGEFGKCKCTDYMTNMRVIPKSKREGLNCNSCGVEVPKYTPPTMPKQKSVKTGLWTRIINTIKRIFSK